MVAYLAINISLATTIFLLFKWFRSKGIDSQYAITLNYLTVVSAGLLLHDNLFGISITPSVVAGTLITGVMFIVVFNIMAITSQRSGVAIASVASKMSMVIPVIAGIILYNENFSEIKAMGVVLALASILAVSWKKENSSDLRKGMWFLLLPMALFLGSGIVDSLLKYLQHTHMEVNTLETLLIMSCGFAAIGGIISQVLRTGPFKPRKRMDRTTLLWGIILGLINYGSLYSLLRVLDSGSLESGVAFSIINVAVVALSTICGRLIFHEKLNPRQMAGLVIAIVAILILNLN